MSKHFDKGHLVVIAITFILFAIALVTKGLTHDLLLEAGVFLVSVKLILMVRHNGVANGQITQELQAIRTLLEKENS